MFASEVSIGDTLALLALYSSKETNLHTHPATVTKRMTRLCMASNMTLPL